MPRESDVYFRKHDQGRLFVVVTSKLRPEEHKEDSHGNWRKPSQAESTSAKAPRLEIAWLIT